MKKLFPLVLSAICLFTVLQATAQVENPTTKTATKKMGYTIMNPGEPITITNMCMPPTHLKRLINMLLNTFL